jgi:NAD(P)-dependent dehydrogenase (short-subunit alcohol dehydrogenase family)
MARSLPRAAHRRFAQMGAKVVIAAVSDRRGEALAREVGAGSLYVPTDCLDEDAIAKAVKAASGLGPLCAAVQTSPRHAAKFAIENP